MTFFTSILLIALCGTAMAADKPMQLFILSGQSNMGGVKKEEFQTYIDKLMPNHTNHVAYSAFGGNPIRMWLNNYPEIAKEAGVTYQPFRPKSAKAPVPPEGCRYDILMHSVRSAIGKGKPTTITFCWMQGERDAKEKLSKAYEAAFKALLHRLQKDLGAKDIKVVIGRLSDMKVGRADWDAIRETQVALATKLKGAWVDTDDLNDIDGKNSIHYSEKGYTTFTKRMAKQAKALLSGTTPSADGRPDVD